MTRLSAHPFLLLFLALSPLAAHSAPPPYWPPYPPPPYYPMPPPVAPAEESASDEAPAAAETENTPSASTTDVEATPSLQQQQKAAVDTEQSNPESKAGGATPADNEAGVGNESASDSEWALTREISTAIQQGNFAEAYYLWRPRAEEGDADAQYGIGWMYHNGYGLAINDKEASAWWELASRQGHIDATFALGMLYGLGEGPMKRDMARAVGYYHQAASNGHEDARLLLRTLMAEGDKSARKLMQSLLDEGQVEVITPPASVKSDRANVRRGPGTKHKVLTTLKQGHLLMPLKREGRWLLLGIEGKEYTGWIHDSLVGSEILSVPAN